MKKKYIKLFSNPNVWGLETDKKHEKGDLVKIKNRYGKETEHIIYNLVKEKNNLFYYSIIRADGYNTQKRAEKKAEKYSGWEKNQDKKSEEYYNKSQHGKDFLSLAEPIKVGHHSEKRHRALIDRNFNAMKKSIEADIQSKEHNLKKKYWEKQKNEIDITMPESIKKYSKLVDETRKRHKYLKENPKKREHGFSLSYAKKDYNKNKKLLDRAIILWG